MPRPTCSISGCEAPSVGRGWCKIHWSRWRRHGDPFVSAYERKPVSLAADAFRQWFNEQSEEAPGPFPTPCRLWTRGGGGDGYGRVNVGDGRQEYAHRVAWKLEHGPIPEGLVVRHIDDHKKLCCETDHLELGTNKQNFHDAIRSGKHPHSASTLSEEQKAEIRRRYAAGGIYQKQLAAEFGVVQGTISRIIPRVVLRPAAATRIARFCLGVLDGIRGGSSYTVGLTHHAASLRSISRLSGVASCERPSPCSSASPRRRMLRAAFRSALSAWPQATHEKTACEGRERASMTPHAAQVWLV